LLLFRLHARTSITHSAIDVASITAEQEVPMLKKIALGGIVVLALVFSLSIATAMTSPAKIDQKSTAPQAPAPHGWCLPPGVRC
jgi:hypothetical protein